MVIMGQASNGLNSGTAGIDKSVKVFVSMLASSFSSAFRLFNGFNRLVVRLGIFHATDQDLGSNPVLRDDDDWRVCHSCTRRF